jgi:hypothetical protein
MAHQKFSCAPAFIPHRLVCLQSIWHFFFWLGQTGGELPASKRVLYQPDGASRGAARLEPHVLRPFCLSRRIVSTYIGLAEGRHFALILIR